MFYVHHVPAAKRLLECGDVEPNTGPHSGPSGSLSGDRLQLRVDGELLPGMKFQQIEVEVVSLSLAGPCGGTQPSRLAYVAQCRVCSLNWVAISSRGVSDHVCSRLNER